jgi:hypothetical protein
MVLRNKGINKRAKEFIKLVPFLKNYFILGVLLFRLRASHLLGRYYTTWARPLVFFAVYFVCRLLLFSPGQPGLQFLSVTGMRGIRHHAAFFHWEFGLVNSLLELVWICPPQSSASHGMNDRSAITVPSYCLRWDVLPCWPYSSPLK